MAQTINKIATPSQIQPFNRFTQSTRSVASQICILKYFSNKGCDVV